MLDNIQLWIFGTAALIDTVLLFALLERHNWRAVTIWMLLLAFGVWSWHSGYAVLLLITESVGPFANPMKWLSMCVMAFGLMLMPSAALHGTIRLLQHGQIQLGARPSHRLALCYLPLLLLVPMSHSLAADPQKSFVALLVNYRAPYAVWLCLVSGFTAYGLYYTTQLTQDRPTRRLYRLLAATMLVIAALTSIYSFTLDPYPAVADRLRTVVCLLPMLPAILFAYFVMRFQLLPLVLERTLVYDAVVTGAILFHLIVFRKMMSPVEAQYQLDFGVVEAGLVFTLILIYPPLRVRVAEALQALFDSSESRRSERQQLAVQLASRATDPLHELLKWFTAAMQRSFGSNMGAAWLCDREGRIFEQAGSSEILNEAQIQPIMQSMARANSAFVTRYTAADPAIVEILDRVRAGAMLRFDHAEISGLFLIGCRHWGQPPSDEDLHAMSLLVEQFGVTLHNSRLLAIQVAAEHRILQQEKLSTIGLIASSLAHEIKNPLSSIKTIIRVLAEDLGPHSRYAEDLRMIGGEIERLTTSTSELLSAARPPRSELPPTPLIEILSPTLRLLHFAQHEATLEVSLPTEPIILTIDQVSLREIVFNLISNAVDAAGPKGQVRFNCRRETATLVLSVYDSGPGIPNEQREQMFDAFFTTKSTGTGLGLYIVARRVRELGGQIDCQSDPRQGTTFLLTLPYP